MPQTEIDVREKTRVALRRLLSADFDLVEDRTNEHSLGGRLARYIERDLGEAYKVDSDYNRHRGKVKRLEGHAISVDIVVHERRHDRRNLLAIEMKEAGRPAQEDIDDSDRLRKMTDKTRMPIEERYGYDNGLFVKFLNDPHRGMYARLSWFKNGADDGLEILYPENGD